MSCGAAGARTLTYEQAARIYKAVAHPFRLWLLNQLAMKAQCVCTLVEASGRTQPYISQQMRVLRRAGLVTAHRAGRQTFYRTATAFLNDFLASTVNQSSDTDRFHASSPFSGGSCPRCEMDMPSPSIKRSFKMENNGNKFQKPWHGIPRQEIEWYPTIVNDRCIGCGLCITSCGRQVFAFDYGRNKAVVAKPYNCMVGCTTCATVCARDALEFPSPGYIRQLIRDEKVLRKTKDQIKEQQEKFDIAVIRAERQ